MKTSMKKTLSMIVVLMMLLTMIPMGIFSVSAEATINLNDYDTATEYVIMNAEDWALIAAATDKDFAGKTVKLGADIDAAGTALAPLFTKFAGTFDGQNYTVSNATVAGTAVIAKELMGGATVQNLKFVNVDLTSTTENAGLVVGTFTPASTGETTTISKISVDATSSVAALTNAGALIGFIPNVGNYVLAISNVSVEAAITATNNGGLIGQCAGGNRLHTAAYINISNSVIASSAKVTGGLVGLFGGGKASGTSTLTMTGVVIAPAESTYALWKFPGGQSEHRTVASGLYVTNANLYSTTGSYTSYFNGVAVTRPDTTINAVNGKIGDVITLLDLDVAKLAAQYDDNGYVSSLLPKNVIKVNAAVGALDAVVNNAAGINAAKFAAALADLDAIIPVAEAEAADPATDPAVKTQLDEAIAAAKTARTDAVAAVLTNLNTAIANLEAAKVALEAADQNNADAIAAATATLNGKIADVNEAIAAAAAAATTADTALKTELTAAMAAANAEMAAAIEAIGTELVEANKAIDALKAEDKALSDANAAQDAALKDAQAAADSAKTLALVGTIIGAVALVAAVALAVLDLLRRKKA